MLKTLIYVVLVCGWVELNIATLYVVRNSSEQCNQLNIHFKAKVCFSRECRFSSDGLMPAIVVTLCFGCTEFYSGRRVSSEMVREAGASL